VGAPVVMISKDIFVSFWIVEYVDNNYPTNLWLMAPSSSEA